MTVLQIVGLMACVCGWLVAIPWLLMFCDALES